MKQARIWVSRILIIGLLALAIIKSPTAFVAALAGVILAGYLIFLWLKWKFWRILSPLAEWNKTAGQVTLNLQPSAKTCNNPADVATNVAILRQNGFTMLGTFTAKNLPHTNVILANHSAEGIHALMIDMEHLGVVVEFCSRYEDGRTFTYSNTKMPAFMPRPDQHLIARFPGMPAQTLLDQFKTARPTDAISKITDAEVKPFIESLYNEIKVYELETLENTAKIEMQLLENFIINSGWSAIEWHRKQHNVVIIHDRLKDYDLMSRYEGLIDEENPQYQKLKGRAESIVKNHPPLEAFKLLSTEIPTEPRFEKIMELTEPIPAHVYLKAEPKPARESTPH